MPHYCFLLKIKQFICMQKSIFMLKRKHLFGKIKELIYCAFFNKNKISVSF